MNYWSGLFGLGFQIRLFRLCRQGISEKFIMGILYTFINEQVGEKKLAKRGLTMKPIADLFEYITTHSMDDVIAEMN